MTLTADILKELSDHPESIAPLDPPLRFRDLAIGDSFSFVGAFERFTKISHWQYLDVRSIEHAVRSPEARVQNVRTKR